MRLCMYRTACVQYRLCFIFAFVSFVTFKQVSSSAGACSGDDRVDWDRWMACNGHLTGMEYCVILCCVSVCAQLLLRAQRIESSRMGGYMKLSEL
ncbi:hypothetical protein BGZ57DRAFT_231743 [Hyaloscypha finlandica]|nr:hypothetical protein BGZ57DRAFT_231743 [Hyaloscypha finlandica]